MIDRSQRQAPEQNPSNRIKKTDEPSHVFFAVYPDEDVAPRPRCLYQSFDRRFRLLEVVDNANRERDIKDVFVKDIINGLMADLDRRMSLEVGSRNLE